MHVYARLDNARPRNMSAGATDPNEIDFTRAESTHDGYLVDGVDRVDLSELRLDDDDDW